MSEDIHIRRLVKVFQAANGDRSKIVVLTEAISNEGLTEDDSWAEADYMAGEGWVETVGDNGPAWVRLTHEGIKTAEAYLTSLMPAPAIMPKADDDTERATSYNFPKIELSEAEREWLGTVCNMFLRGQLVDVERLKRSWQSQGKWPRGLRPFAIDGRLLQGANHPTLLGVWHAYPVNKWIPKCDELIRYIKGRIEASSSTQIKVSEIARALEMPERNTSTLIRLLPGLGFGYTATSTGTDPNKVRIPEVMSIYDSLRIDDPEKMDDYLSYEGIEEQVWKMFGTDNQISTEQHNMNKDNLILDRYELIQPLIGFKINIENQLSRFPFEDNVFLMMKFRPSNKDLGDFIIDNLQSHGLRGVRADANEWNITRNVYNPIAALYCCKYGIALFDEPEKEQTYSPNVAYELGIMHYQQKECLILRHASLSAVPFDLVKDLYVTYERDLQVKKIISDWVVQISGR